MSSKITLNKSELHALSFLSGPLRDAGSVHSSYLRNQDAGDALAAVAAGFEMQFGTLKPDQTLDL